MLSKILLVVFVLLGTIAALVIASSIWGNIIRGGADAVDVALVLRSPFYWLMVAAILFVAGWLLKHWLFQPRP
jgi:hypothetical protein